LAARFVRDEEAAGSNPATPTTYYQVRAYLPHKKLALAGFPGHSGENLEKILRMASGSIVVTASVRRMARSAQGHVPDGGRRGN
jgi:tryptophan synthase alpha subunit